MKKQAPRQIILIMTDTQRKDMVGCYGNPDMKTPNLDRLASEGIRFERAYTCQPVCGPARSALFTGLFPHSCGGWANSMPLGDNVKTVGQRLTDNGLHCAYIGKWHLDGGDYFGLGRCPAGWDPEYWYDMRNYLEELTPEERRRSRDEKLNEDPSLTEEFTFAHRCSNRALTFLEKNKTGDYLLVVSYDEPHDPSICPEPFASMYKGYRFPKSANVTDPLTDKPEHHRVWAGSALNEDRTALEIRADYHLGCNSYVDYEIGRVLDAVNQYAPDALVIYTSDHGVMMESHRINAKGPAVYDEIANVPLIIRKPGLTPAGSVCTAPSSHIDLVPTIMNYMDLPQPKLLEGRSMLPMLTTPETGINSEVFIEFGRYEIDHDGFGGFQPLRGCCDGRYKLAINLLCTDELYDLKTDPEELNNLIGSGAHAEIRNRLHDRLIDWMNTTRDPFRGYYWERRPWRTDARPATWKHTGMTRQREDEEYEPRQLDYHTGLEMETAVRAK